MIDKSIGERYEDLFCDDCKEKVMISVQKLTWKDKLNPKRLINKFMKLCCEECIEKVLKRMRNNGNI